MSPAKRGSLAGLQPVPAAPPPLPARPAASSADTQTPEQRTPEVRSPEVQTPEAVRPKGVRAAAAPEPRTPAEIPGLPTSFTYAIQSLGRPLELVRPPPMAE